MLACSQVLQALPHHYENRSLYLYSFEKGHLEIYAAMSASLHLALVKLLPSS